MKRYALAALAALLVFVPWQDTAVRATAPLYNIEDLGNFNGLVPTITGVNAAGQVVGNVSNALGSQAVRYTNGVGWQALPGLDTSFSVATGINASGDVSGYHITLSGAVLGFRYRDGFGVEDIAPLVGGSFTSAFAINATGTVVGYADGPAGVQAFRADPGLPAEGLPSFNGGYAVGCGINAGGTIVGASVTPAGAQHGMRIDPGSPTPVEVVAPDGPAGFVSLCAVDADGRAGGAADHGGVARAFLYSDGAGGVDVDTFGSTGSNVESLSAGVAVGWYTLPDTTTRAFAHTDADGSFDLNTRISDATWVLLAARGVNANGVIVGDGLLNGASAAFRLTPVATDTTAPVISSVTANPSAIALPNGQMVGVTIAVNATDDSGNAPACALTSITGGGAGDATVTGQFTGDVRAVGGRTYTFHAVCADAANNHSAEGTVNVTVATDTTAPVISLVSASPSTISPADGRVVPVTVSVPATDNVDASPACSVTGVTGGAAGDASVTGALSVQVKATGNAVYTVNVRCADAAGNTSDAATAVSVVAPPPPPPPPPPTDTKAPVIRFIFAMRSETKINRVKWENVKLLIWSTDNVDHSPFCSITSITGAPADSYAITGRVTARLRELRSAGDLDRVYVLHVSCVDDAGNTSTATVGIDPNGRTTYSGDRRRWRW